MRADSPLRPCWRPQVVPPPIARGRTTARLEVGRQYTKRCAGVAVRAPASGALRAGEPRDARCGSPGRSRPRARSRRARRRPGRPCRGRRRPRSRRLRVSAATRSAGRLGGLREPALAVACGPRRAADRRRRGRRRALRRGGDGAARRRSRALRGARAPWRRTRLRVAAAPCAAVRRRCGGCRSWRAAGGAVLPRTCGRCAGASRCGGAAASAAARRARRRGARRSSSSHDRAPGRRRAAVATTCSESRWTGDRQRAASISNWKSRDFRANSSAT